jgi:FMN reductase
MTLRVGVVVGNPRVGSRTKVVAEEVARQVADAVGGEVGVVLDLAEWGPAVLDFGDAAVAEGVDAIRACDVVVVASPTYKATYTGLLKAFLDRFQGPALAGRVAVGVMVGGSAHHALAGEVHLRPLLVELGAVVPARNLYVIDSELEALAATVGEWLGAEGPALVRTVS